jgi:hypothetical protein
MPPRSERLPPTGESIHDPDAKPYFLWWLDATIGDLRAGLADPDPVKRGYWLGALLREANTRDVWYFVTADEVRAMWPYVVRHLGRSRAMWAWLLDLPEAPWPPEAARRA